MLALTGYLDRFSARPGGRLEVKVSSTLAEPYQASLVRIVHGDPNPAGPGMKLLDLPAAWAGRYPSRFQPTRLGSYARVPPAGALAPRGPFTITLNVMPTLLREAPQAVLSQRDAQGRGYALLLSANGAALEVTDGAGRIVRAALDAKPAVSRWYRLWAAIDPGTGRIALGQLPHAPALALDDSGQTEAVSSAPLDLAPAAPLLIAASQGAGGEVAQHFNGRIEDPAILASWHEGAEPACPDPRRLPGAVIAWWDFAQAIEGQAIIDAGPHGLHGVTVNLPTRAVRSSRWTGAEMCWRHAPSEYAAIHFHEDDLYDCGWPTDFSVNIPPDMKSGVYGVKIAGGGHQDIVPFYVLPPKGQATAPIAFLASTFTYQAYANHARGNTDDAFRARRAAWGAYPHNPDEHTDYGRATYNKHSDGSGICYSSRLRPILTMRPGFLTFNDARGSGLRHFPADTHLLDWLEAKGLPFDVITDEDLDEEGVALLRPYRAVLTGSHPEYHTPGTLDAIAAYTEGGGRLCYLGGNGCYWRIARSPRVPGVIEIRRAEGGIRSWAAEPGEYYNALDGGFGGLWRRNGRPPQMVGGVGFSGQGLFEGSHYRRMPAASNPRAAWIFAGVEEEILGDFGLSGGGAAGFELDRADFTLGTPLHALILARSENHQAHFVVVPEELLSHLWTVSGEKPQDLIRGEIVFYETPKGGAVFAVGSITFCGSLSHNGYDNPISRMLENVVRRFMQ
ncbi:MAG: N,N-dimethylformamidase large subunit [Alphaproteobacteria bacterium]|nr:N,N-dimethylformamidase large subunit [Alphaproteobacteria bacterium]